MPSTGKITSADEIAFTRKVDDFGTADLDDVAGPFPMQVRDHPRGGPEVQRVDRAGVFAVAGEFFRRHLR